MLAQIGRRCNEHTPDLPELAGNERPFSELSETKGNIYAFRHEIDDPVVQHQFQIQLRIGRPYERQRFRHDRLAEAVRRRDANRASERLLVVRHVRDRLLDGPENPLATLVEGDTFGRAIERTCTTQQEPAAEIRLKPLDAFARGG